MTGVVLLILALAGLAWWGAAVLPHAHISMGVRWSAVAVLLWYVIGFASFLRWELQHRRLLERRYQPANMAYFPPLGPGLALAIMGPFLLIICLLGQPPSPRRESASGASSARASREHPAQLPLEDDDADTFEQPLRVAK